MEYKNILIENNSGVVILTVNRPQALNALNMATISEIGDFFTEGYKTIADLKGVIITGSGEKAFVAGADIKEFLGIESPEAGSALSRNGHDAFNKIERFHRPTIAAVQGFCLGGGFELALACHMRIAGEKAKFSFPEVNLGLLPGFNGSQRLPMLVGKAKAFELLMTTDMIQAEEAVRLGMANHVVPQGEEIAKATEIIEKIATKAPLAIAEIIKTVNAYQDKNGDGTEQEIASFGHLMTTKDFGEGTSAFIEKRKAEFTGE